MGRHACPHRKGRCPGMGSAVPQHKTLKKEGPKEWTVNSILAGGMQQQQEGVRKALVN